MLHTQARPLHRWPGLSAYTARLATLLLFPGAGRDGGPQSGVYKLVAGVAALCPLPPAAR